MSKTNKKEATRRNFYAETADMRQRSAGGGAHKDKRTRRQSRTSWKKELAFDF